MLLIALAVAASCGGDDSASSQRPPCVEPTPLGQSPSIPKTLALEQHATITAITTRDEAIGVTAVSDLSVVELYPPLARGVLDSGFRIIASDNEGFEAEIFFGDQRVTGAYRLREAPCKKQVIVKLLYAEKKR